MSATTVKVDKKLLNAVKLAVRQLIKERNEDVCDLVLEEAEDTAFGRMIEAGLKGPRVPEEDVMKILKGKK